mmetsp:Transcript_3031/g.4327  ORF Transcript_3031/g.4327 Transcript_3031/m.4327 type:complete len:112 (+) Transcript_3031:804-1139(+)
MKSGDMFLFGKKAGMNSTDKVLANLRLKEIGFVFQAFNLLPSLTAFENVELPMLLAGKPKKERIARVYKLLDRVGMLHRTKSFPAQLSGGGAAAGHYREGTSEPSKTVAHG